jgi:hypothetical protein
MESTAEFNPTQKWYVEFNFARFSRCLFAMLTLHGNRYYKGIITMFR